MSAGKPAPSPRQARREAQRQAAHAARSAPQGGRSPLVWLTGGALFAGALLVATMILANRPTEHLALVAPSDPTPLAMAAGRAVGAADARVTFEAYEDFQCPTCGLYSRAMEPRLMRDYVPGGRVRIVFHDFAFLGPESLAAAAAARAADAQGAFWPYHDWLFANQNGENKGGFRREVLVEIARRIGLDVGRFERDLDAPTTTAAVQAETGAAAGVPVRGTPTFVVNGKTIETQSLAWATIAAAIDAALPGAPSASP